MARRKQEVQLQQDIQNEEDWNEMLGKEGLIVVDVYQQWCGPCKAMDGAFRRLLMEQHEVPKYFLTAKADTITSLEDYRGRCEPVFLFYAGKQLVEVIRGANAPLIMRKIQEQLQNEEKILRGTQERKVVTDPFIVNLKHQRLRDASRAQFDRLMNIEKEVTVCIIKPDAMQAHKKEEIIAKIKERGYEIVEQKELKLSEEQVRDFYKHKAESPQFEDLVKYMTSDVSCVLALTKGDLNSNVVKGWRDDIGVTDSHQAKNDNPNSFRALYGTDHIVNAIHGSESKEAASRELAFFFPNFRSPKILSFKNNRTLALIRPTAYEHHRDAIIRRIEEAGFKIAMKKVAKLSREQAEEFYDEHRGKVYFEDLVNEMSCGPMMVLCLVKENAIKSWRDMLGPKEKDRVKDASGTLRHEFDVPESPVNALHGSSNEEEVVNELSFFFPMEQTLAVLKPGVAPERREQIEKRIVESGFLIATKKTQKLSDEIAQEIYKDAANKPYFNDLIGLMTKDDITVLVLSRENAVEGWRQLMGPVDPARAKEINPNSIRAVFGEDILNNAVHGPSNPEQVERELKLFFGDIKFDPKGNGVFKDRTEA